MKFWKHLISVGELCSNYILKVQGNVYLYSNDKVYIVVVKTAECSGSVIYIVFFIIRH